MGALTAGGIVLIILGILGFIAANLLNFSCSAFGSGCYSASSIARTNIFSSPLVQAEIFSILMLLGGVLMVVFGSRNKSSQAYDYGQRKMQPTHASCEICGNSYEKMNWHRGQFLCANCYNRYVSSQQ